MKRKTYPPRLRFYPLFSRFQRHWFNLVLIYLGVHIVLNKDISLQVSMTPERGGAGVERTFGLMEDSDGKAYAHQVLQAEEPTFSLANLTPVLSPDYGRRKGIPASAIKAKLRVCKDYVRQYAPIAVEEMHTYGIPASITLAQGLLESNAGESKLALESRNHFGIKCRSKCLGCTCRNYSDDDRYDMFRVFDSVWDSYREHSLLLTGERYSHLFELSGSDYEAWAHGLKQAGYATDRNYADKLIRIIEELKLYRYDRQ